MEFDEETCYGAARKGQLKVLQWLRSKEMNCPWDIQECLWKAKENRDDEMNTWIVSFL